jgi:hypothetical protein
MTSVNGGASGRRSETSATLISTGFPPTSSYNNRGGIGGWVFLSLFLGDFSRFRQSRRLSQTHYNSEWGISQVASQSRLSVNMQCVLKGD